MRLDLDGGALLDPAPPGGPRGPAGLDPPSLLLLCQDAAGWRNLCELLTDAHAGRDKGEARVTPAMLDRLSGGLVALAGGLDGPVLAAARARGRDAARDVLDRLVGAFGAAPRADFPRNSFEAASLVCGMVWAR